MSDLWTESVLWLEMIDDMNKGLTSLSTSNTTSITNDYQALSTYDLGSTAPCRWWDWSTGQVMPELVAPLLAQPEAMPKKKLTQGEQDLAWLRSRIDEILWVPA
jgi:hypothetical protein